MNKVIWKGINGLEDYFEISNKGEVKSLDREIIVNGGSYLKKGKIRKVSHLKNRRTTINLKIASLGINVTLSITRLVYSHFIGNINDNEIVTFKDGNNSNYYYKNLYKIDKDIFMKQQWETKKITPEQISKSKTLFTQI